MKDMIKINRLYNIRKGMKKRCYYLKDKDYKNYGGRGVSICEEWLDSWRAFQSWALDNGYSNELSIDRIDVNGNYEPSNCKWATAKEQANNKRNNINLIEIDGELKTLNDWSELMGINYQTLYMRYIRGARSSEELFKNIRLYIDVTIEIDGEVKTAKEWSKQAGIEYLTLYQRFARGVRGRELLQHDRIVKKDVSKCLVVEGNFLGQEQARGITI